MMKKIHEKKTEPKMAVVAQGVDMPDACAISRHPHEHPLFERQESTYEPSLLN